jgi:prevent-host-death family protein
MLKKVNALKARQNFGQIVEEVYYKGDQFIIERAGKPMAAVVPLWQLEDRSQRRERLSANVGKVWQSNAKLQPIVIEREVEEAVRAVRTRAGRKKRLSGGARHQCHRKRHSQQEGRSWKSPQGLVRGWVSSGDFPAILEELRRVLRYPKISHRDRWSDAQILEFVENVTSLAILVPGELRLAVVAEDPSDDRYFECAVEGEAGYVVSGDRHVVGLAQYEGVEILAPRAFFNVVG